MRCSRSTLFGWPVISNIQKEPVAVVEVEAGKYSEAGKVSQAADNAVQVSPADDGDWLIDLTGASVFGGYPNRRDPPSSCNSTSTCELSKA